MEEPEFFWGAEQRSRQRRPIFRETVLGWISALKSTDIRKPAKDPLTPDVPVPDAFAGYIDPSPLEPALRRSPVARERLLQAIRASIVDIAAAI